MTIEKLLVYVGAAYVALSALVAILTALASVPGRFGAACHRAALVVGKVVAALGELRGAGATPPPARKTSSKVAVLPLLAFVAVVAPGCGGTLPPVSQIVLDAGCVATHYDELAAAEAAGPAAFLSTVGRVAVTCGIARDVVVTVFGTHKQARASRSAAPACSASVRP